jgi:hypothetical protein
LSLPFLAALTASFTLVWFSDHGGLLMLLGFVVLVVIIIIVIVVSRRHRLSRSTPLSQPHQAG